MNLLQKLTPFFLTIFLTQLLHYTYSLIQGKVNLAGLVEVVFTLLSRIKFEPWNLELVKNSTHSIKLSLSKVIFFPFPHPYKQYCSVTLKLKKKRKRLRKKKLNGQERVWSWWVISTFSLLFKLLDLLYKSLPTFWYYTFVVYLCTQEFILCCIN